MCLNLTYILPYKMFIAVSMWNNGFYHDKKLINFRDENFYIFQEFKNKLRESLFFPVSPYKSFLREII